MNRSKEKINKADLKKLRELAYTDIEQFFERNPIYKRPYKGKEVLVALCQGAALHYIDGKNGVKDFDVWFFYPRKESGLPFRRRGVADFGPSKFGRHPNTKPGYVGRTVDVLMRSEQCFSKQGPESGLARYLSKPKTKTAKLLGQKAVIGLYPENVFGRVLWPENH